MEGIDNFYAIHYNGMVWRFVDLTPDGDEYKYMHVFRAPYNGGSHIGADPCAIYKAKVLNPFQVEMPTDEKTGRNGMWGDYPRIATLEKPLIVRADKTDRGQILTCFGIRQNK